jgi:hypothetical protein
MTQQELELLAVETMEVITEKIISEHDPITKIRLIRETAGDWGCTDKLALNYDRNAKYDDNSCIYVAPPNQGG